MSMNGSTDSGARIDHKYMRDRGRLQVILRPAPNLAVFDPDVIVPRISTIPSYENLRAILAGQGLQIVDFVAPDRDKVVIQRLHKFNFERQFNDKIRSGRLVIEVKEIVIIDAAFDDFFSVFLRLCFSIIRGLLSANATVFR